MCFILAWNSQFLSEIANFGDIWIETKPTYTWQAHQNSYTMHFRSRRFYFIGLISLLCSIKWHWARQFPHYPKHANHQAGNWQASVLYVIGSTLLGIKSPRLPTWKPALYRFSHRVRWLWVKCATCNLTCVSKIAYEYILKQQTHTHI